MYTMEEIKEIVVPVAQKYRLPAVYLFGSYARGTATDTSDIDLLVDTTGTSLNSLFALGALYCELEEKFCQPVDLITVSALEQRIQKPSDQDFRETVLNERVELYAVA